MSIKQVIVIRKDLNMRKGKMAAQASHASMGFIVERLVDFNDGHLSEIEYGWFKTGNTKIVLQVDSEEALLEIYNKAKQAGLEVNLVVDKGLTEFHGVPTKTCLAIGPDYSDKIDKITGHLKLY